MTETITVSRRALWDIKQQVDDMFDRAGGAPIVPRRPKQAGAWQAAIIIGHSRASPGYFSRFLTTERHPNGMAEYTFNSMLAPHIVATLRECGIDAEIFTRDRGGVAGAYEAAGAWGAKCTLELHCNASDKPDATGTETVVHPAAGRATRQLAQAVQDHIVKTLRLRDRGVKDTITASGGRGTVNLAQLAAPGLLVEPFFASNPVDADTAEAHFVELARAIAHGVHDWFVNAEREVN